jgi:hypothetical protein
MSDLSDSDWHEAFAREAEGDPSPLVSLFLESTPLHLREKARAVLRKLPKRGPSDNDRRIARAVRDIENATPAGTSYSNATLSAACAAVGVSPQVVASFLERRNRQGVTLALEELGHHQRRGYHRTKFLP